MAARMSRQVVRCFFHVVGNRSERRGLSPLIMHLADLARATVDMHLQAAAAESLEQLPLRISDRRGGRG
jgi:hypothetical protein